MVLKKEKDKVEVIELTVKEKAFSFIDRTWRGLKTKGFWKDKIKPAKTFLIEMKHYNGTLTHTIIAGNGHKFNLGNNTYVIDEECKEYNNSTKIYMLRYHEGYALPYKLDVASNDLKKASLEQTPEIATSFNPSVLKDVLKFEYAKGVIQGAEVSEILKKVFILTIVVMGVSLCHLLINAVKSGWV